MQNSDKKQINGPNNFNEIEKFVMFYEDKIYFYDVFFDYMENFTKKKKIRFDLKKDKPNSLGNLIESILKDWIKTKKELENYKKQIKILIK